MNEKNSNVIAILALIFGIIGLLLSCVIVGIVPSLAGFVLGIVALSGKQSKGMAISGIVCGVIGMFIALCVLIANGSSDNISDDTHEISSQSSDDGGSSLLQKRDQINSTETDPDIPEITEQVIYEDNDVTITVTGIDKSGSKWNIHLLIENDSALNLEFNAHAYSVNGIMTHNNIYDMDCDVASGKKANVDLGISTSVMKKYNISSIRYVDVLFWAYDNDSYFKSFDTEQIRIETSLYDGTADIFSGETIYDSDGIKIDFLEVNGNNYTFCLTNTTGEYINVDFDNISINDYTVSDIDYDLYDEVVLNNNQFVYTIKVSNQFKQDNGIDEVEAVEWNLTCRPYGDYFSDYKVGPIVYTVNP